MKKKLKVIFYKTIKGVKISRKNKQSKKQQKRKMSPRALTICCILFSLIIIGLLHVMLSWEKFIFTNSEEKATVDNAIIRSISDKKAEKPKSAFLKHPALEDKAKSAKSILLSPSELKDAGLSIADINLRCAQGLPGSENLDIDKCLETLEEWAELIRKETVRCLPIYRSGNATFYNSEAYFHMLVMITVLQRDLGVKYNPILAKIQSDMRARHGKDYEKANELSSKAMEGIIKSDSRNVFIHGLLTGKREGTCASMPVLVVSISRLLGYPVSLVCTKRHLFVRWEDDKERINFEVTSGLGIYPDEFYAKWPFKIKKEEAEKNYYLKSMDPLEEYALSLQSRSYFLENHGKVNEAIRLAERVKNLVPNHPFIKSYLNSMIWGEMKRSRNRTQAINGGLRDPIMEKQGIINVANIQTYFPQVKNRLFC